MAATLKSTKTLRRGEATMAASSIGAFIECSPQVQEVVREMVDIINDDDAEPEDTEAAVNTLIEALFPGKTAEICTLDDGMFASPAFKAAKEELDREEAAFSDRVRHLMEEKGITQEQLAREANITQPAVSNILNRKSRPQRRTIARFAAALGVDPADLWPTS